MNEPGAVPGGQEPGTETERAERRSWRIGLIGCLGTLLLLVALVSTLLPEWLRTRPRLTDEQVRALVTATIQREARQAFLVTGELELAVTTRVTNTRRLLPGLLDVPLGTAESTVRVPGRVVYGIAVADLHAAPMRVRGDTIDIDVPAPRVQAVDPQLERMEVETEAGWLRLGGDARQEVQQRAIELVRGTLEAQAVRHLAASEQPRINTAETLHELLYPVFVNAGIASPILRFRITEQLDYTADRPR